MLVFVFLCWPEKKWQEAFLSVHILFRLHVFCTCLTFAEEAQAAKFRKKTRIHEKRFFCDDFSVPLGSHR